METKKSKLKKPKVVKDVEPSGSQVLDERNRRGRREWFAVTALQGLCANESYINVDEDELAANAVVYADALIAELEKTDGKAK